MSVNNFSYQCYILLLLAVSLMRNCKRLDHLYMLDIYYDILQDNTRYSHKDCLRGIHSIFIYHKCGVFLVPCINTGGKDYKFHIPSDLINTIRPYKLMKV
jgi:hypothetical protein